MAPSWGYLHFGPCTCRPNAEKRCLTVIYERISTGANTPWPNQAESRR